MKIENFVPRECGDPSGLLVLRLGTTLDEQVLRDLCDALVEAEIVDPLSRDDEGEIAYPLVPAEVVGLSWRPPTAEAADARRHALKSIGSRFGVESAWCFQSRYGLETGIRAGWFPESLPAAATEARRKLVEATSEEASAEALAELTSVLGGSDPANDLIPADSVDPARDLLPAVDRRTGSGPSFQEWQPGSDDQLFPVDGYPEIIKELQWDDFGIAVKLGGPRLAGEEQVVRAFHELWFKSFSTFRHVGVEYDPVRRAAVLWTDRWSFPSSDEAVVHYTLWIARQLHQVLTVVHARFQEAEMAWKYRALTGDTSEPFILAGNPLGRVFRAEGERAAMAWIDAQTAWSDPEVAAMLVEVVEQHDPSDPEDSVVAIRLADRALTHDPDQNQARADILFTLVRRGRIDEALDRARQWGNPGMATHLVDLVAEHATGHVPAAVDVALDHVRLGKRPDLAARLARVAAEHAPDRVPIALAAVPTAALGDWAGDSRQSDAVRDLIPLVVEHAPDRMPDILATLGKASDGRTILALAAHALGERGGFSEALTIYDAIIEARDAELPLWIYNNALWIVQVDNNKLLVQPERARRYLAACLPHGPKNPAIFYNAACVWFELDEVDRTFECLRLARQHEYDKPFQMRDEQLFRPIADDPRFKEIFADLEGIDPDELKETDDVPF